MTDTNKPGFRIITTAPNFIEPENATEITVYDMGAAREAFDHRVAMAHQHAEYGSVTVIDDRPDRHHSSGRIIMSYDRKGVYYQLAKELSDLISQFSNRFVPGDAYEINARGGNSDRAEAKAEGQEEVTDAIRELLESHGLSRPVY